MIRLVDVYDGGEAPQQTVDILYRLLAERPPEAAISHRRMPSLEQHRAFVDSRPYEAWYLLEATPPMGVVGSIYLTKAREVGIFISAGRQGKGYGREAIARLREAHPGRLLANVAPGNHRSIQFFKKMGARHIQNTYEL